ncbi:hypothetical protein NE237_019915 [Protea cynaroides]|uniref:Uncharacterized protein n=1 Tax=Protea cynaroides TaxID=273540 RepID=A0A9Q0K2Y6_9MAGN|nr:hypothetical protein NE237_019915 [Protea cynaroides]
MVKPIEEVMESEMRCCGSSTDDAEGRGKLKAKIACNSLKLCMMTQLEPKPQNSKAPRVRHLRAHRWQRSCKFDIKAARNFGGEHRNTAQTVSDTVVAGKIVAMADSA